MRLLGLFVLTCLATRCEGILHRRDLRENWDGDVEVSTSYASLREVDRGLHHIQTPDTNAFSALIVSPDSQLSSTHLAYNCTSTSKLWDLQTDVNVLSLEASETMDGEIVAAATIRVANCNNLSSVDRVVVGNAFFGSAFSISPVYFYVVNSSELNDTTISSESCRLRLQLARATFAQVYPDCKIKFRSTDIANLIRTESSEATAIRTRRKLETSSFGFVKDSSCKYDCGEESDVGAIDADKCWAKESAVWTGMQCKVQFYEKNSKCSSECGEGDLSSNQCYDCSSGDDSCASSYSSTDDGCCRVLKCEAVEETTAASPGTLSWNLDNDTLAVSNSSYPIFETGNCSDTSDPLTDCCRITCENCFLNISIASMFADVEIVGTTFDEAIEMEWTGNANLEVALFAPNGCTLDETTQLKNASFTIPLGETGMSIEISMGLDLRRKLSLQPHGSPAFVGASADLSLTAGSLRSKTFNDIQIVTNTSNKLAQSSIDLEMELELIPSFKASLSLLKGLAQIGVKVEFLVFVELASTFQFPEPFAGLSSEYVDESSLWHGGDCRLPHFMEYNCNAGYGEVNISIPLSVKIPVIGNTTSELDIVSSSDRSSYSLFSGCVATAYDAEIILLTAINTVSSLSDEHKEALQTILTWTLGMTDIGSDFVNITSVSSDTGEISITLSVPPSLGELYLNASVFETEVYRRARNESFASTVTNYVGLEIAAQCGDNRWGADCDQSCVSDHCTIGNISCNSVDGTILSCDSCNDGYWGSLCESTCEIPDGCTSARCSQSDGGEIDCVSCEDDDSSLCEDQTSGSVAVASMENSFIVLGLLVCAQIVFH